MQKIDRLCKELWVLAVIGKEFENHLGRHHSGKNQWAWLGFCTIYVIVDIYSNLISPKILILSGDSGDTSFFIVVRRGDFFIDLPPISRNHTYLKVSARPNVPLGNAILATNMLKPSSSRLGGGHFGPFWGEQKIDVFKIPRE